ncbi:hypothetical protein F0562_027691 [Nyssa sinensis]|uniref:Uncharacterized protein n=1 Tax=Nyssa sinensis TaxID=561372 RepID=A0A5J5B4H0_9ASTE|nr:hypothetical protein F0562_027691 [Nyssa sinensis]
MEGIEFESRDAALKPKIAVRCAKAAILLSSLKTTKNRCLNSTNRREDESEESEMLQWKAMEDLRGELARERMKNRRMRLCSVMELLLQITLLLSLWTFCLVLAFKFL